MKEYCSTLFDAFFNESIKKRGAVGVSSFSGYLGKPDLSGKAMPQSWVQPSWLALVRHTVQGI